MRDERIGHSEFTDRVMPLPPAQKPSSVQPGGGWVLPLELAWARWRRCVLRRFRPGYVKKQAALRQGDCPNCPHDIVDARDLKYVRNVCGYHFPPGADAPPDRPWMCFARYGVAELIVSTLFFLTILALFMPLALHVHWLFWIVVTAGSLFWLEMVWFFRDPERKVPDDASALVSPADGKVTNVEEVEDPELGKVLRISIFLSVFNVHVNRVPRSGKVLDVRYFPGAYLDARDPESAVRNEQLWLDLEDSGRRIRIKQISGAIARRIVCWLKPGDMVERGKRLGMIKLGSRTDVLIPAGSAREICVQAGDLVLGASTVLVKF